MADEATELREDRALRVIEFYSGVGGMHYALKGTGICFTVVAAVEINTTANHVYKHNFPGTNLLQKNIEGFTAKELNQLNADIFVMSPPCQPFTRLGNKGASSDPRTRSFLHILELLPRLPNPPGYVLMENVKGFETSDTRGQFIKTLKMCGYSYQEFLLSPSQFGIPNSRLRYYLLAKRKPLHFYFTPQEQVFNFIPRICRSNRGGKSRDGQVMRLQNPCFACEDGTNVAEQNRTHSKENDDSVCQSCDKGATSVLCEEAASRMDSRMDSNMDSRMDSCVDSNMESRIDCNMDSRVDSNMDSCVDSNMDSRVDSNMDSRIDSNMDSRIDSNMDSCVHNQEWAALYQNCPSESDTDWSCGVGSKPVKCRKLAHFLEKGMPEDFFNEFRLPKKVLSKFALLLDIVTSESDHSCCFTKAYGHYAEGTGSVLKMSDVDDVEIFNNYRLLGVNGKEEEKAAILSVLGLRYFTPREVANLQCLPQSFSFPLDTTIKQKYRLLGNSLNVKVVAELLKCLLRGTSNTTNRKAECTS